MKQVAFAASLWACVACFLSFAISDRALWFRAACAACAVSIATGNVSWCVGKVMAVIARIAAMLNMSQWMRVGGVTCSVLAGIAVPVEFVVWKHALHTAVFFALAMAGMVLIVQSRSLTKKVITLSLDFWIAFNETINMSLFRLRHGYTTPQASAATVEEISDLMSGQQEYDDDSDELPGDNDVELPSAPQQESHDDASDATVFTVSSSPQQESHDDASGVGASSAPQQES